MQIVMYPRSGDNAPKHEAIDVLKNQAESETICSAGSPIFRTASHCYRDGESKTRTDGVLLCYDVSHFPPSSIPGMIARSWNCGG
jgi:hypothetical protein